jgi:hypothetical protein
MFCKDLQRWPEKIKTFSHIFLGGTSLPVNGSGKTLRVVVVVA